ncbi:hypothetical protein [Acrocarpospora catenulata]|uniref:hypothetical protein n=1 Tax=Acrocarpospora catenulata TaxID=2836182 RepID=UPI001BDB28A8|nr:hypothetical protein [Acrocarpospora catenulata]
MRRAIVLGGSIGGVMAARVLSDYFDDVTIIERDDLPVDRPRSGVPQSAHLHVLLDAGRVQLDRWFPGFSVGMLSRGAVLSDNGSNSVDYVNGHRKVALAQIPDAVGDLCSVWRSC